MTTFTIEYLNPCEEKSAHHSFSRRQKIISMFQMIDWYEHKRNSIYSNSYTDDSIEFKNTIHDFYFFSIEHTDFKGHTNTLMIVASNNDGNIGTVDDVRFDIEYRRPKLVNTSKLAQFFGKPKEKLKTEYMSHTKNKNLQSTLELIKAFIDLDTLELDQKIDSYGYLYD